MVQPQEQQRVVRRLRPKPPHTFDVRLKLGMARIEAALKSTDPGTERDLLERRLRQFKTALDFNGWLSSTELKPPKLMRG